MPKKVNLQDVKVTLDETDNKLFPKRKAKSNFGKTITKPDLTKSKGSASIKHKELGKIQKQRVRTNRKETDMQKIIQARKYAALAVLTAGNIYGISQYTSDMVVLVGGIVLTGFIVEKASK